MFIPPVLFKDFYKVGHKFQYPDDAELVYSNMTARKSRIPGVNRVVPVLMQYFVLEFLYKQFNERFFSQPVDNMVKYYKRRIDNALGKDSVKVGHIGDLHDLGYLPLKMKAVPEGTFVPMRVPFLTTHNTKKEFYWLTNMLETLMSLEMWGPINSCTIAVEYLKQCIRCAKKTGGDPSFVQWQNHDFSMRGMFGLEATITSGAAHLLAGNTGTDTIPAIDLLEWYYGANSDVELVGGSVPATEHSVMSMGMKESERDTFKRLITQVYSKGIVSIVSDTWDLWKVLTEIIPSLKAEILARDGKVVIRPDSGDPVKIICGDPEAPEGSPARLGVIHLLWQIFGGTTTPEGYHVLDSHIGAIYGDSITIDRQREIFERLAAYGFASTNMVFGVGSYTYQMNTRDTLGQAMKATYGETARGPQDLFKDPVTDDGTKKSATGLLRVDWDVIGPHPVRKTLVCKEKCTWEEEAGGVLQPIFEDGVPMNFQTMAQIRSRIREQINQELAHEEA